ncbi:MAG: DUF357 domain-containing protein [Candidatus Hodarchaeaceae archaeon]|nr:DUF357 domain-containing protein [Candidatus Hodarchaeaceae archaeon]
MRRAMWLDSMLEQELAEEIEKWSRRLDDALSAAEPLDDRGGQLLENARAYNRDHRHFLGRGDLIRSFECLIWAWALLEVGEELGHLRR